MLHYRRQEYFKCKSAAAIEAKFSGQKPAKNDRKNTNPVLSLIPERQHLAGLAGLKGDLREPSLQSQRIMAVQKIADLCRRSEDRRETLQSSYTDRHRLLSTPGHRADTRLRDI